MAYIEGHTRDLPLPLPASVEDYVAADNPVQFIAAFADNLDLSEAGFLRATRATGRSGNHRCLLGIAPIVQSVRKT